MNRVIGSRSAVYTLWLLVLALVMSACAADTPTATQEGAGGTQTDDTQTDDTQTDDTQTDDTQTELMPVVIGQGSSSLAFAVTKFASVEGYFEAEGLSAEIQIFSGGTGDVMAALEGGSIQIAGGGGSGGILASARGLPVITVGTILTSIPSVLVFSKDYADANGITAESSEAEKLAALEDARFGSLGPSSGATAALIAWLEGNGISANDVDITPYNSLGATLVALEDGRIDATASTVGLPNEAIERGVAVFGFSFLDAPNFEDIPWVNLHANKSWADENPDVLTRFMTAIAKAEQFIKANPDEAGAVLAAQPEFEEMLPSVFQSTWETISQSIPDNPVVSEVGVDRLVTQIINPTNEDPIDPDFDQVVTNRFAEAALDSLP